MPVNKNKIENNNKTRSFPNIKIILLGVLLATSIIGGLCYYFASSKKPSKQPVLEVIKEENNNQEITENNNQTNNEENIENKKKEEEKQPEIIINNEYIPVIDCLWLNILIFVIFSVIFIAIEYICFFSLKRQATTKSRRYIFCFLSIFVFQVIFFVFWFLQNFLQAAFSKIWDKEHSWWSNVKKGFLRNRIYFKEDYFWTFWLLDFVVNFIIVCLITHFTKNIF